MILKDKIKHNLISIPGSRTNRKLVVIESDDWGSIRIPNGQILDKLVKNNLPLGKGAFNRLDSLEQFDDVYAMLELFEKFKDKNGNSPVITANFLTANPDFQKIEESHYSQYFAENIIETYSKTSESGDTWKLILEGIDKKLILPQYHGREHLNRSFWMQMLQDTTSISRKSFPYEVFCLDETNIKNKRDNLMAAFDFHNETEKNDACEIFKQGYSEFEKLFGYKSESFISPCYVWHESIEKISAQMGVNLIQGIYFQNQPDLSKEKYILKWHYNGQKNIFGQKYVVRNCFMEVFENPSKDNVKECIDRMEIAFRWGKPAIIGMHRVNFIGSLDENNRKRTIESMGELFTKILKKWPDIEFISTDQLTEII